jgi:hypothetical protein
MVLLGVDAPITQAMIIGIQAIVAVLLLATSRPASKPATASPIAPATPAPQADSRRKIR